ncbi:hypothetical protein [Sediminispirochaeta bajacaliforniensis]|uniref:hypothetical protein n=1 Tax=Sediminispirochaeta bajacaliforniensis TaxID=148 RepID=UPI0003A742AB|nr:hypothetical protein [Sediminispirochaeta bajacaliforniensis]
MADKSGSSTTDAKSADATATGKKEETKEAKGSQSARYPIEELGAALDPAVFAGVCEAQRWSAGKKVDKKTFDAAVWAFEKGGVDGKRAS